MGNCCKDYGGEQEEITNVFLQPVGYDDKKEQEANENFSFDKALEVLSGFEKKILPEDYFKKGVEISNKKLYKTEILLNNRLINAVYKIAEFRVSHLTALKLFNEYLSVLTLRQCQFILRSYGYYIDRENEKIGFLYEHLDDTLDHYIFIKSLDLEKKLILIKKLIETLIHIHSKGIILLDLSPRNIMFDNNWKMRITKFENSINREKSYLNRSVEFTSRTNVAPEILLETAGSSPSCDIWSLGILIIQLFTGITTYIYDEPPKDMKDSEYKKLVYEKLKNKKPPTILDLMETTPDVIPLKAIAIGMIRFDPNERPDIFKVADVMNQYFNKHKRENCVIKYEKSQREEYLKFFNFE